MTTFQLAYDAWYQNYHGKIQEWVMDCGLGQARTLVLYLPELLQFTLSLAEAEATPAEQQATFKRFGESVLRGIDYLPDSEVAVYALQKDAELLAQTLEPHLAWLQESGLAATWRGDEPLETAILGILGKQPLASSCAVEIDKSGQQK